MKEGSTIPKKVEIEGLDTNDNLRIECGYWSTYLFTDQGKEGALEEDFGKMLSREEKTDCEIHGHKIHKRFVERRVGKKIEEIVRLLKGRTKEEAEEFLEEVYTGKGKNKIGIEMKSLRTDLKTWYSEEETKDFGVQVIDSETGEEVEIHIHKEMLQARSEVFRGMFNSVSRERETVKEYTGKDPKTIEVLFEFLYTDNLSIEGEEEIEHLLSSLEEASDFYQLNPKSTLIKQINTMRKKHGLD